MPQAEEATERTRDARDAALTLFAEYGYHGTSVGQIAKAIGLKRSGSLYNHITGKQELLADIMLDTSRQVWEEFEAAVAGLDDPVERLRRAIYSYVRRHLRHPRESTIVNRDVSSLEQPTRDDVLELRRGHADAITQIIEDGLKTGAFDVAKPRVAAFAVLEMCVSVTHWFRPEGSLSMDEVATDYSDFALGIVNSRQPPPSERKDVSVR